MLLEAWYKYKQIITRILEQQMDINSPPSSPQDIEEYLGKNLLSFLYVL